MVNIVCMGEMYCMYGIIFGAWVFSWCQGSMQILWVLPIQ